MRLLITLLLALALLVGLGSYAHWIEQRPSSHYLSDLRSQVALDIGEPGPRGNLLGIQPELFAADYQSLARLRLKLAAYLDHARDLGMLNDHTVVVLPEHIGTWLLAVGEKEELYRAAERRQAMHWLAASNPLDFLGALFSAGGDARLDDAMLRTKAKAMARDYQQLFGDLARDYQITLVAGSIVLPEPRVARGRLEVGRGPLYNVSLVFDRAGNPQGQPQRHAFRAGALATEAPDALQVLDTPAGRLGVLLGGDIRQLSRVNTPGGEALELLAMPSDLDSQTDDPHLDEQLQSNGIRAGLKVHLRGRLWERSGQPQALVFDAGHSARGASERGAQLINLWL
ncbi:carbon-nitrogen hydrolase family protein [Ectopseudomonas alcaliphila]|uniref:carbon-nitrogen hydrolase family protein n=1 Tax=Ectopseudomonas alcaliphila TaxID=101564 RepID=UPI00277FFB48|nr:MULTISPECIES: carbon-nitrogen hydrolase family protein [Pseudomonas]MDP9941710.1 putative amidohydrolase [Pseudomonas sp. 3400]MDR7013929.1 putative amidohydrolase [Pseudomonas alcaliphila]